MGIQYNKLVRDKIPAIIKADGQVPVTHILDTKHYRQALLVKLVEEAIELRDSNADMGERADVEEVLKAIDAAFGYNEETVEAARMEKASKRGGFEKRIFLERIDES